MSTGKADLYTRITNRIIADLEQGVRPWFKPWNAEHAAGRVTRPLRHNGQPYRGINVVMLWGEAMARGFAWRRGTEHHHHAVLGRVGAGTRRTGIPGRMQERECVR